MGRFKLQQVLRWMVVAAIFAYLGKMVWENWAQVREAQFSLQPLTFFLSTLIYVSGYFIQIWAWYLITLRLGIALPFRESLESWVFSLLGKYLPGKVWLLLGRFYLYERRGKPRKAISLALYLETTTIVIAAGLLLLVGVFLFKELRPLYGGGQFAWLALFLLLACLSLHPKLLQRIMDGVLSLLKKETSPLSITYKDILLVLVISVLSWSAGGVGFYLFVASVFPISLSHILFVAGALAFASLLGLIAVFTPGGLGVREGVLVYLLSFVMPASVAAILSILSRLWMTLIEIGLIGVIYLLKKFHEWGEKRELNG